MRIAGESPLYEPLPLEASSHRVGARSGATVRAEASFSQALKGVGGAVDRGEALLANAARGNLVGSTRVS